MCYMDHLPELPCNAWMTSQIAFPSVDSLRRASFTFLSCSAGTMRRYKRAAWSWERVFDHFGPFVECIGVGGRFFCAVPVEPS